MGGKGRDRGVRKQERREESYSNGREGRIVGRESYRGVRESVSHVV